MPHSGVEKKKKAVCLLSLLSHAHLPDTHTHSRFPPCGGRRCFDPAFSSHPSVSITRLTRRRQPAAGDGDTAAPPAVADASRKTARRQRSSSAGGGEPMEYVDDPVLEGGVAAPLAPEPMDGETSRGTDGERKAVAVRGRGAARPGGAGRAALDPQPVIE
jgi:hypothetical protein